MSRLRVLFLCTGNSARSIIAEALLKRMGGPDFDVCSAGTHPKGLNSYTLRTLQEAGIPSEGLRSKGVDEFLQQEFDYVITVCDDAAEQCPVFPGQARRLHWSLPDPAAVKGSEAEKLEAFQQTLQTLRNRLQAFIRSARGAAVGP